MALETASFVANLQVTNPDGGDARSTADDHLRLIKAALVRTFPNLDGPVSLSATQVMYLNDLSASVQLQLNQLRDGSATANNAINARYAQSASVAANIGSIPAARVLDLGGTSTQNAFTSAAEVMKFVQTGYFSWYSGATLIGQIQTTGTSMLFDAYGGRSIELKIGGTTYATLRPDGVMEFDGVIDGTITNAQSAATATTATNATHASSASFANSCTSASSAQVLAGFSQTDSPTADTIARRGATGTLEASYFRHTAGIDPGSVGWVCVIRDADGYIRPVTTDQFGTYVSARNITTKSGTAKTLAAGSGPPSLVGSTNGDIFYYY